MNTPNNKQIALTEEQLSEVNGGFCGLGKALGNKVADWFYGPLGTREGGNNRAGYASEKLRLANK